jgi:hypothetical protein
LTTDPGNIAYVSTPALAGEPILEIVHDYEDRWICLSATPVRVEDIIAVARDRLFELDPALRDVSELPLGFHAVRPARGQPWQIKQPEMSYDEWLQDVD